MNKKILTTIMAYKFIPYYRCNNCKGTIKEMKSYLDTLSEMINKIEIQIKQDSIIPENIKESFLKDIEQQIYRTENEIVKLVRFVDIIPCKIDQEERIRKNN